MLLRIELNDSQGQEEGDTGTSWLGVVKGRRFHFIPLPSEPASRGPVGTVILIHPAGHQGD